MNGQGRAKNWDEQVWPISGLKNCFTYMISAPAVRREVTRCEQTL
jgi:hypothetical protein